MISKDKLLKIWCILSVFISFVCSYICYVRLLQLDATHDQLINWYTKTISWIGPRDVVLFVVFCVSMTLAITLNIIYLSKRMGIRNKFITINLILAFVFVVLEPLTMNYGNLINDILHRIAGIGWMLFSFMPMVYLLFAYTMRTKNKVLVPHIISVIGVSIFGLLAIFFYFRLLNAFVEIITLLFAEIILVHANFVVKIEKIEKRSIDVM